LNLCSVDETNTVGNTGSNSFSTPSVRWANSRICSFFPFSSHHVRKNHDLHNFNLHNFKWHIQRIYIIEHRIFWQFWRVHRIQQLKRKFRVIRWFGILGLETYLIFNNSL